MASLRSVVGAWKARRGCGTPSCAWERWAAEVTPAAGVGDKISIFSAAGSGLDRSYYQRRLPRLTTPLLLDQ